MSKLKIIIGNSGQEKINYIYNYFKTNSRNSDGTIDFSKKFFLIVPEQDTASKQRKMLDSIVCLNFILMELMQINLKQ